jgi:hypothetical protein
MNAKTSIWRIICTERIESCSSAIICVSSATEATDSSVMFLQCNDEIVPQKRREGCFDSFSRLLLLGRPRDVTSTAYVGTLYLQKTSGTRYLRPSVVRKFFAAERLKSRECKNIFHLS